MKENELGQSILRTILTLNEEIKQKKEILNNLYINDLSMFGRPDVVMGEVIDHGTITSMYGHKILITKLKVNDYRPDDGRVIIEYHYRQKNNFGLGSDFLDVVNNGVLWLHV